mmetsp:Transcript_5447/g.6376  ORF Transcript_5447/g.6376 Transcript_5447/m.6376 type:complete len:110 (-) Transcript_5447:291-620(-)|eukprot:CAMPEP_0198262720 /NCGR_PEP_ID=MMETSP1447-20131203/11186_1 /TAXON_ID=420782 /ORGANISM="Chaetoceros dichaeta, Strain CCMP1751" /LENGTH=109 /DNA_ID=CAMNT_0043951059 /DNA_START=40 /DNA_END=369 /DNA_ORIENTATION=-
MDTSLISISTFMWAFNKVRPSEVVDKIVDFALDIIVPGRGTGGKSWWTRGVKRLEVAEREFELRSDLQRWDREFPFMHHELLIRYSAGLLASSAALCLYDFLRDRRRKP